MKLICRISLLGLVATISCKALQTEPAVREEIVVAPEDYSGFKVEERIVRGDSLAGLINNGSTVKIVFDYYKKNEVARGDVVAYAFAGNKDPIIKIVRGIPGDKFGIVNDGVKWRLTINGEIAKNSKGEPYSLDDHARRVLSLYVTDYKGVIPRNTYLILGNLVEGTIDSTRFGLVDRADILGKVVYK